MDNNRRITEVAIIRLMQAWDYFLEGLSMIVYKIDRELLRDEEYFRTDWKKGKSEQQINNRIRKHEKRQRDLRYYTTELEHYTRVNQYIMAGYIKPYCIKTVDSFNNVLGAEAYYFVDMPDGKPGFFSDKTPEIVRKADNFKFR